MFGIQKTERFYLDIPGFRLEYGCEEAYFLFASFGESRFILEQFHEDGRNTGRLCCPLGCGAKISIAAKETAALCRRLQHQGAAVYRNLSTVRHGGTEEVFLQAPASCLLRLTHAGTVNRPRGPAPFGVSPLGLLCML